MDIQGYILDRWKGKLNSQSKALIVYDPTGQYVEVLQRAKDDGIEVIDTSIAPLNARLRAVSYWCDKLIATPEARLIIYRRRPVPSSKREWVMEPYAGFAQSAQLFPNGPVDYYRNMCEQFLPTKTKELNELFAAGNTSFNFVNSLLGGNNYPALETLTGGHSIVEITTRMLALESCDDMNWLGEWNSFASAHYPGLDTNASTLPTVQNKLWSYLLFSEFVLDLPSALPESLSSVPCAPRNIIDLIYDVCGRLRADHNMRDAYVNAANEVANALNLPTLFARANHLGERVTFKFENNIEFTRFIDYVKNSEIADANRMLDKNKNDVWYQEDPSTATFWNLAEQLLKLIVCIENGMKTDGTLMELVQWYADSGYRADEAMRSFLTLKYNGSAPREEELAELFYAHYRDFVERSVKAYQTKITEITSLPQLANQMGSQFVYPSLDQGKRVAMLLIDAFRYEIGNSFATSMKRIYPEQVSCETRLSVLPSVTRFGMANHLDNITMVVEDESLQPAINGKTIKTVPDRISYLQERTGVEVQRIRLDEFTREKVNESTRLLVLSSTSIDNACEQTGAQGVTTIHSELKLIASAVDTCRQLGFQEIYVGTDHGFMLQPKPRVSDKIDKPVGSNICLDEPRCLVGSLNDSSDTLTFSPQQLGINGDFMKIAYPKNFTVFRPREKYYHQGLSLQENVVPIVCMKFKEEQQQETFSVSLKYKGQASGTVRTYGPLIDVSVIFGNLFSGDINFKIKVQDHSGNIVGEPSESEFYDDATEIIHVTSGVTSFRQRIEIKHDFEDSEFVVLALDSNTNAQLAKLVLQFDVIG